ncbi:MAG: hypothetical protein AAF384_07245 [Pseudomonadota bacterium]
MSGKLSRLLSIGFIGVVLAGCAAQPTNFSSIKTLTPSVDKEKTIALMPIDVQLSLLTASGVEEPKAEWTKSAEQYMRSALKDPTVANGINFVDYVQPEKGDADFDALNDLEKLHGAVGEAILLHKYIVPLQSKKDKFDWSLGTTAQKLKARTDANYALFLYARDSYSSAGRVAVQVIAAALTGYMPAGGSQVGFASLVDLTNGDIVWFNHLNRAGGDLRTAEPAKKSVEMLLTGMPR